MWFTVHGETTITLLNKDEGGECHLKSAGDFLYFIPFLNPLYLCIKHASVQILSYSGSHMALKAIGGELHSHLK